MASTTPEAFPHLSPDEMHCIGRLGVLRRFADGEVLFASGDRDYSFFAIQTGTVLISESSSGMPREVTIHGANEFTGDVSMLTGRPAVVTATAQGVCEAIEISSATIRRVLAEVPDLSAKLLNAFQVRRQLLENSAFVGVRVIGSADSKEALRIREFFYKNKVPHTFQDIVEPEGQNALQTLGLKEEETPILVCSKHVVRRPSLGQVAECLGISRAIKNELYDVLIVGAGPSGLAAAVYGASEGLKTLIVDGIGPGGQAGQSSRIENYMGFPAGIAGAELANLGFLQAMKFGAEFTAPVMVRSLEPATDGNQTVKLCTGQTVHAKTVLVSTGVSYRRLPVDDCERLEGAGVFYSATTVKARMCRNATAVVVGGGNSAGQAAMFLGQHARRVKLLLRGDNLRKSMSDYLARRIETSDCIDVLRNTEIRQLNGTERLESVVVRRNTSDDDQLLDCAGVFVFVGAKPHTEWLPDSVALDDHGFVLTGPAVQGLGKWPLEREPCELETSWPGVFAAGDVRSGTTKRCAFAAGDGALAVTCVHQYLTRE